MTADLAADGPVTRGIALVAHDTMKPDMCEWAAYNKGLLRSHRLYATGTTGQMLVERLDLPITRFRNGPHGGDQQIGARIAEGEINVLVFFWDPLCSQPHEPDVRALLRLAVLADIPVACNRASADFLISSPLMGRPAAPMVFLPRAATASLGVRPDRYASAIRDSRNGS
ncbi:MAG: methylglyoxal synthase [Micromonosporaceae bacterium]